METCELFSLIPREKLKYLFANSEASAELDCTFLAFEHIYRDVLKVVPTDMTIIDLGCAYATQSWYFRDHKKYIGVDIYGNGDSVIHTENSEFYFVSIQHFINEVLPTLGIDLKKAFAICSYVPDDEARSLVAETFPYCRVYYPGIISLMNAPDDSKNISSLDPILDAASKCMQAVQPMKPSHARGEER